MSSWHGGGPSSSGCTWRGTPAHAAARTFPWTEAVGAHGTAPSTPVPTSVTPSHEKLRICCFLWYPGSAEHWKNVPTQYLSVRLIFRRSASHLGSRARRSAQAAHKGKCSMEIIPSAFLGVTPELPAWCSQGDRTAGNSLSPRQLNESWRRLSLPAHNYLWLDYHPWKSVEDWRAWQANQISCQLTRYFGEDLPIIRYTLISLHSGEWTAYPVSRQKITRAWNFLETVL